MTVGGAKIPVRVAEVTEVNELIRRFRFVRSLLRHPGARALLPLNDIALADHHQSTR